MKKLYLLLLLTALLSLPSYAQQPFAIRPYAITLPRVTTGQQTNPATVPQQAGNMVYNTDQQAVAVNNGVGWGYLGAGNDGEFKNIRRFRSGRPGSGVNNAFAWTPPASVTRFMVEIWAGGNGGGTYFTNGVNSFCIGGSAGDYAQKIIEVISTGPATFTVGSGGSRGSRSPLVSPGAGGATHFKYNTFAIVVTQGGGTDLSFNDDFLVLSGGDSGPITVAFGQKSATEFMTVIGGGNGGRAYDSLPATNGLASTFTLKNGAFETEYNPISLDGTSKGSGGGCGYNQGGNGANGLVIIRW